MLRRATTNHGPLDLKDFQHESLDSEEGFIRVIKVDPELTTSGRVQCTITHSHIDDEPYACLSYVWGGTDTEPHWIVLNGGRYQVRSNLWHFLSVARFKHQGKHLWIDAMCIDQTNMLERNHQVQQMGGIYSQAREVIAWLGNHPDVSWLFRQVLRMKQMRSPQHNLLAHDDDIDDPSRYRYLVDHNLRKPLRRLSELDYWKRAWITQEMALARKLTFMSEHEHLDLSALYPVVESRCKAGETWGIGRINLLQDMLNILPNPLRRDVLKSKSLVELLDIFASKQCGIKRDRIFSLLALCGEGSSLQVDYSIQDEDVLAQTLAICHRSMCFCTVATVAKALNVAHITSSKNKHTIFATSDCQAIARDSDACKSCGTRLPSFLGFWMGELFCMRATCADLQGHIVWAVDPITNTTSVSYVIGDCISFEYDLGDLTGGCSLKRRNSSGVRRLRFTLDLMLRVVRSENFDDRAQVAHPKCVQLCQY